MSRKTIKKAFSLLEILVAICLLSIASGAIAWKMHKAIRKKEFQSQLERFEVRLCVAQKLAVTMQADWKGVLEKRGKQWVFETECEEINSKKFSTLQLKSMKIFFENKPVERLVFDFFASGQVLPVGVFRFKYDSEEIQFKTVELFQREEGQKRGPLHPDKDAF